MSQEASKFVHPRELTEVSDGVSECSQRICGAKGDGQFIKLLSVSRRTVRVPGKHTKLKAFQIALLIP